MLQLNHTKSGDRGKVTWIAYLIRDWTNAFDLNVGTDLSVLSSNGTGVIVSYGDHRICMDQGTASMIAMMN